MPCYSLKRRGVSLEDAADHGAVRQHVKVTVIPLSGRAGRRCRAPQAWLGHKNIQHTVLYTELALQLGALVLECLADGLAGRLRSSSA